MASKAVVLVVGSLLAVSLIVDSTLISIVYAEPTTWGTISCGPKSTPYNNLGMTTCCADETGQKTGITIRWCVYCIDDGYGHVSDCSQRFNPSYNSPNPPTNPNPTAGKYMRAPIGGITTGNNSGTPLPPGSIIKVPPGTISASPAGNTGNATNPGPVTTIIPPSLFKPTGNLTNAPPTTNNSTGNTIARGIGTYSPTGYCVRSNHYTCLPCDPGLPSGRDTCIPGSEWPGPTSFKNNTGSSPPPVNIVKAPAVTTTQTCPDGSQPDSSGKCPTTNPSSNTNNLPPNKPPPSGGSSSSNTGGSGNSNNNNNGGGSSSSGTSSPSK
jgi:hypothetical protein